MNNKFLDLKDCKGMDVGGKAEGLARLIGFGCKVPAGFVIQNANAEYDRETLEQFYQQLGAGKVAVRSSALGEDSEDASFAGQYETILNVEGAEKLHAAVHQCIDSLQHERAQAYREEQNIDETQMCVVIQNMVDAHCAGVLFSADPVSGRHDLVVIDAVLGLGEALVSGEVTPDHYLLKKQGGLLDQHLVAEQPVLQQAQLNEMVRVAVSVEKEFGQPIDMEWAIDQQGEIFWLQARPITTLSSDLNELLNGFVNDDDVVTRCNIGEMMPGAVDPLTYTTSGWTIEHSMQYLHQCYGLQEDFVDRYEHIAFAWGQMLINLSTGARTGSGMLGASNDQMTTAICGRLVPEIKPPPKKRFFVRLENFFKLIKTVRQIPEVIEESVQLVDQLRIENKDNSKDMWQEIESHFPVFEKICDYHIQSSSGSGFSEGLLQNFTSKNKIPTAEDQAEVARLLAGADGVESAELVEELDKVVDQLMKFPNREDIANKSFEEFRHFMRMPDSELAGGYFREFIKRHGHRGYRELSMRDPSWADDPNPVINNVHLALKARIKGVGHTVSAEKADLKGCSFLVKKILPYAHECVRRREKTKSLYAKTGFFFKRAYRHLAKLLEQEGKLPEADLMYFYTRQELGEFIQQAGEGELPEKLQKTVERAYLRRKALAFHEKIKLPDISVGVPEPVLIKPMGDGEKIIVGRPVSRGVVTGIARVAKTPAEASEVEPGEILVAPITDVGWTPYFASIAGLATDLGSAVSHGAVIAREYGLPCVVNLQTASQLIKTGDKIKLDADKGILEKLS